VQDPPVALDCLDLIGVREGADPIPLRIQPYRLHEVAYDFPHPVPLGDSYDAPLCLAQTLEADDRSLRKQRINAFAPIGYGRPLVPRFCESGGNKEIALLPIASSFQVLLY